MSVKTKLTFGIASIALIILILYTWMFFAYSKAGMQAEWNDRMRQQTKDVADTIETIQQASMRMERLIGGTIKLGLQGVEMRMGPDYRQWTAERLENERQQADLSSLSVYSLVNGSLTVVLSTNPLESGQIVSDARPEAPIIRRYLSNQGTGVPLDSFYWDNRLDYAADGSGLLEKRGFFYARGADYVLSGAVTEQDSVGLDGKADMKRIMDKTKLEDSDIAGIAVINPDTYTGAPQIKEDGPYWNRQILYSSGNKVLYPQSVSVVQQALQSEKVLVDHPDGKSQGSLVNFYYRPFGSLPIVILLTADDASVNRELRYNLLVHLRVSLFILLGVMVSGYLLAGQIIRPLRSILIKVNQIAVGEFGRPIVIRRRDEFGILAAHINRMSSNLESHTNQLEQTVEELRSTKEYLESVFGNTSDAIHVVDIQGRLLLVNEAFLGLYGYKREELEQTKVPIVPGLPDDEEERLVARVQQGGMVNGFETAGNAANGKPIHVSITVSPIRSGKGNVVAYATITRNMTERKQTEELLRRSEKLSIVGQLAAGVAHEIRNPLTTLRGFVQLQQKMNTGNPSHLELMLSELDRINFIVSEFLILAKPQATHFAYRDPRRILQEILVLLETQANMNNIGFITEFADDIPDILCESNQLKQVFVNLLKNAIESMPDGGSIRIEVRRHDENQVMIRIVDEGCGIPEDRLAKLGEPFYSNKENGTGLGLMVCQQIVSGHKGNMLVRSKVGAGTTVEIVLPVQG